MHLVDTKDFGRAVCSGERHRRRCPMVIMGRTPSGEPRIDTMVGDVLEPLSEDMLQPEDRLFLRYAELVESLRPQCGLSGVVAGMLVIDSLTESLLSIAVDGEPLKIAGTVPRPRWELCDRARWGQIPGVLLKCSMIRRRIAGYSHTSGDNDDVGIGESEGFDLSMFCGNGPSSIVFGCWLGVEGGEVKGLHAKHKGAMDPSLPLAPKWKLLDVKGYKAVWEKLYQVRAIERINEVELPIDLSCAVLGVLQTSFAKALHNAREWRGRGGGRGCQSSEGDGNKTAVLESPRVDAVEQKGDLESTLKRCRDQLYEGEERQAEENRSVRYCKATDVATDLSDPPGADGAPSELTLEHALKERDRAVGKLEEWYIELGADHMLCHSPPERWKLEFASCVRFITDAILERTCSQCAAKIDALQNVVNDTVSASNIFKELCQCHWRTMFLDKEKRDAEGGAAVPTSSPGVMPFHERLAQEINERFPALCVTNYDPKELVLGFQKLVVAMLLCRPQQLRFKVESRIQCEMALFAQEKQVVVVIVPSILQAPLGSSPRYSPNEDLSQWEVVSKAQIDLI